jgi:DNA-binding transcriptional LysR family regulator
MTLKHMKIFKEVCTQESITKASVLLNMAQPAVSVVIRELEDYYELKLFERLNRRIYITDAGKTLLQYADTIIQQFEEVENSFRCNGFLSTLRVGSNISLGDGLLPVILEEFGRKYPHVLVTSIVNNTEFVEKKLNQNEMDLAIIDHVSLSTKYKGEFLFEDKLVAVCGKKYERHLKGDVTLNRLAQEKLLVREKGSGLRSAIEMAFARHDLTPNFVMESLSTNALINAAVHNLGVLILSERTLELSEHKTLLHKIAINEVDLKRNYYIVYNASKYMTQNMISFIELAHTLSRKQT